MVRPWFFIHRNHWIPAPTPHLFKKKRLEQVPVLRELGRLRPLCPASQAQDNGYSRFPSSIRGELACFYHLDLILCGKPHRKIIQTNPKECVFPVSSALIKGTKMA